MKQYKKPLPEPDLESKPYWDACKRHELVLERCAKCGTYRFYPSPMCHNPKCLSMEAEWVPVSGKGEVYSFSVVYRPPTEAFLEDVPYVLAVIKLDEGPGMMSNIIGCKPEEVKIGMRVQVVFDDVTDEITLPKFTPIT